MVDIDLDIGVETREAAEGRHSRLRALLKDNPFLWSDKDCNACNESFRMCGGEGDPAEH